MRHERNLPDPSQLSLNLLTPVPNVKRQKIPAPVRFRKMLKRTTTGCLEFTGAIDPSTIGYGRFRVDDENVDLAHRFAFFLANGWVPKLLRHTCHNPACCDEQHLLPGTHKENSADMVAAGRQGKKLQKEQVKLIVKLHRERGMSAERLADQFGVNALSIRNLLSGKSWAAVTGIQYQPKHQSRKAA